MLKRSVISCLLLLFLWREPARAQGPNGSVRVEIVATASEYVPRTTTISHAGHSYTNCMGSTSFFGQFSSYGGSGTFSGAAETNSHCSTTFTPPSESTLTRYSRVNYTIARGDQSLYLLACTQNWKPTARERVLVGIMASTAAGSGSDTTSADRVAANAKGKWTDCPAFGLGSQYSLTIRSTSDARLEDAYTRRPMKLEYLSSGPLPAPASQPPIATQAAPPAGREATLHITSSPTGAEIYIDGKFFGNTPSDITITVGEHVVKVTSGGKEWLRTVQVTAGDIRLNADLAQQ